MSKVANYLNRHLTGNVFDKQSIREAYMTDRSLLYRIPRLVALPETTLDLRKIMRLSHQLTKRKFRLPITVRGGGNDKTGAAIGSGMLVSMEKMNHVQEIDVRNRLVRVQAGITLGELNAALAMHGLTVPIAGHEKNTIGGLIANCPSDDYAAKHGGIFRCVEQIEVVLSDSTLLQTEILHKRALKKRKADEESFASQVYNGVDDILVDYELAVQALSHKELDAAGYSTITMVRKGKTFDLLPLFFNSQGTLGIISEVILRVTPLSTEQRHVMITSRNIRPALDLAQYIQEKFKPLTLNIYDSQIFRHAIGHGNKSRLFEKKPKGDIVIIASFDKAPWRNRRIMRKIVEALPRNTRAIVEDNDNRQDFQDLKSMLMSYLNDCGYGERVPIVDDVRIPFNRLASFISDVKKLGRLMHIDMPIYGSVLTENYSARPEILLDSSAGRRLAMQFLRDYTKLVKKHHGSINGGGPEGGIKALVTKYSPDERQLYEAVKNVFDPHNILNPHVKLGATPRTSLRRLRNFYNRYIVEP